MPEQNRIALVTGGSRGLGANTVLALARRGVNVIFTYRSGREEADKVAAAASEAGADAVALQLDSANVASFDDFVGSVHAALDDWGVDRFDYLVNNAGMSDHTPFAQVTEDLLDRVYSVNFKGVFLLTQKLVPVINDGGRIINISSGLTRFWTPDTRFLMHRLKARSRCSRITWPRSWDHAALPSTQSHPARSRLTSVGASCATTHK